MMTNTRFSWSATLVGVALVGAALMPGLAAAADAAAGRIIGSAGTVSVIRNGAVIRGKADTTLKTGDILVTGSDGSVQWQSADESLSVIAANSRLVIQEYSYKSGSSDGATAHYELKSGGYGTMSGQIQSGYKLATPAGDITVDGTKFKSVTCNGNCAGVADGTYVAVVEGKVTMSNGAGSASGAAGQVLYASGPNSAPAVVDVSVAVFASFSLNFNVNADVDVPADFIERPVSPS